MFDTYYIWFPYNIWHTNLILPLFICLNTRYEVFCCQETCCISYIKQNSFNQMLKDMKMKIAIITAGRLPVPATKGGAVETKLDYTLAYNATHHLHDITIYSICPDKSNHLNNNSSENHYFHINNKSLFFRIGQKLYAYFNRFPFYDNHIEFFLYLCLRHIKHQKYDVIITTNRPGYTDRIYQITQTSNQRSR